ncbi:NRDE family protein [Catellatospora tritici]|uniref:NRDE family protein n=1 Tax=Catellatospora tritici TaxID=2851566 RepID=UPI001C2CE714|nr:NRDE family protein [Catellatospora tritici]MBV1850719.1 NRDE family protein [Catellatospora tritici]MBV1850972.1 NRDE family protein [Catellatospora tritici]
MCTVALRYAPDTRWPVLLLAVRDEFTDRPWLPPAAHWPGSSLIGGLDLESGGTWLAVDPATTSAAVVVNAAPAATGGTLSRGELPLRLLSDAADPAADWVARARGGFHALRIRPDGLTVWSWDGSALRQAEVGAGRHVLLYPGLDDPDHPRARTALAWLATLPEPDPRPGLTPTSAWGAWTEPPHDLLVDTEHGGRRYASTSAALLALGADGLLRYDFTADPAADTWAPVRLPAEAAAPLTKGAAA